METIIREKLVTEKINDKKRIAHCENILGYIFLKQENFEAAETGYNRYINLASALKDSMMMAHALGELSDVYTGEKKYRQAVDVLLRTINLCDRLLANPGTQDKAWAYGWVLQYKVKRFYGFGKAMRSLEKSRLEKK